MVQDLIRVFVQISGSQTVPSIDDSGDGADELLDAAKVPKAIAWRVMIPKKISTMLSHDPDVGVKCRVILAFRSSQPRTTGCLWVQLSQTMWSLRRG